MKKIAVVIMIGLFLASVSLAAVKKTAKKPIVAPAKSITKVAPPAAKAVPVMAEKKKGGWLVEGNLEGGAGVVELGYLLPVPNDPNRDVKINLGYGLGNKYNLMVAKLNMTNVLAGWLVGLSIDYANYSSAVLNVPALGNIEKGGKTGLGISIGKNFNRYNAKLGYSTALGVVAGVEYRF